MQNPGGGAGRKILALDAPGVHHAGMKILIRPFSPMRSFAAAALLGLAAASAARAEPADAVWPDLPVSLSPSSLCSSNDAAVWGLWAARQSLPGLATVPAAPGGSWEDHTSSITPFHVLHLDAPATDGGNAAPQGPIRAVFEVFSVERSGLDLPRNEYGAIRNPVPADYLPAPVRPLGAPVLTETRDLPGPLPCDLPVPPSVAQAVSDCYRWSDRCCFIRLRLVSGLHPIGPEVLLPPFRNPRADTVLASRDLALESWKKLSSKKCAAIPFDTLPPPDLLSEVPALMLSSNAQAAILSDEGLPSLRRLLLAAVPIDLEGATNRTVDIPGVSRHSQFLRDHWQSSLSGRTSVPMLPMEDPLNATNRPPALRVPSPFAAVSVRWFAWSLAAFLAYLLAIVLLLVRWFRRPPQDRSGLWLAVPAASVLLAALVQLSGHLLLPRGARAVTRNLRIGCATFPEEFCVSATRFLHFRPAWTEFRYPSPAAVVRHGELPGPSRCIRQGAAPDGTGTLVLIPPATAGHPQQIQATWYEPANCPLALHPQPAALAASAPAPADGNPFGSNAWYAAACASRAIVPERDLDGLWVHIGGRWYDLGPVRAGEPVAPDPAAWAKLDIDFAPYASFPSRDHCKCGKDDTPEFRYEYPPADAPWVTVALDTHTPPAAGPLGIPPENQITQTLWITEWP